MIAKQPLDGEERWILVWAPDLSDLIRCTLQGNHQGAVDAAERLSCNLPEGSRIREELPNA